MLCRLCESIFWWHAVNTRHENGIVKRGLRPHQRTLEHLLNAAANGCHICNRLKYREEPSWKRLEALQAARESDHDHLLQYEIVDSPNAKGKGVLGQLVFYRGFPDHVERLDREHARKNPHQPGSFRQLATFQLRDREAIDPTLMPTLDLAQSTRLSWDFVEPWLQRCRDEHPSCGPSDMHWHPTRLLDFLSPASQYADKVRLISLPDGEEAQYAALSHRWGDFLPMQLTTSNKAELEAGIEVAGLPKTFRDALHLARRLDLYLWIDSLCIVQDSREDWEREARVMGMVYANAEVTIAATGARNSLDGLFFDRQPSWVRPCIVERRPWDNKAKRSIVLVDYDVWADGIDAMSLNKRAWVVQERHLSRRVIHCSREQLFWECRSAVACEAYPNGPLSCVGGSLRSESEEQPVYSLPVKVERRDRLSTASTGMDWLNKWDELVSTYTDSALTFEEDKLFAIAGLAKTFSGNFDNDSLAEYRVLDSNEDYMAGLWRSHILFQLSWTTVHDPYAARNVDVRRTASYVAPTWSWASLNGAVAANPARYNIEYLGYFDLATVKDISMHHANPRDPFVDIKSGSICIEAWTIPFRFSQRHMGPDLGVIDGKELLGDNTESGDKVIATFDIKPTAFPQDLIFLPLYQTLRQPEPSLVAYKNNSVTVGLVLRSSTHDHVFFERVGDWNVEHFYPPTDQTPLDASKLQRREVTIV